MLRPSTFPGTVDITVDHARKLALVSQRLPLSGLPRGLRGVRDAIRHLGYVQIDTISVVERAHHHTLWARVPHYRRGYLDRLIAERAIFEYWSHAAAYLPMENFRFCLLRMNAIANGQKHWYPRNAKVMAEVLARIRGDGPLQAGDFEAHRGHGGMWQWGPVKQAIERLFMEGELLVTRREGFQKIFDLAERVIPAGVDTSTPTRGEYAHYLVDQCMRAHGIVRTSEIGYGRQGMGAAIKRALAERLESGEVLPARIQGGREVYFLVGDFERRLNSRLARRRVRILSPFDNLVIQRQRIRKLFDFDFQLECYTPASKRRHGYFCLPILWQGRLAARMDAKADRRNQRFLIRSFGPENSLPESDELAHALCREIEALAAFTGCRDIAPGAVSPPWLRRRLRRRYAHVTRT